MQVWLVRHAIAEQRDRSRWPDDAQRPLTAEGRRKFRKAARGLARLLPGSAALLSSPFVRARDTATMLARASSDRQVTECGALSQGRLVDEIFKLLRTRKDACVVLVGHEPDLGKFLSTALFGEPARLRVEFKKGGAARVDFERRIAPGAATLRCLLPPRVLRAIG